MERFLRRLLHRFSVEESEPIIGFIFQQIGDYMLLPFPGQSGIKYVATPNPVGVSLPAGSTLTWSANPATDATIVADEGDPSGLTADISIPTSTGVGTLIFFTLRAVGTYPDGSGMDVSSNFSLTVVAAPIAKVTGFTFAQSV
jgi:hypothetical protein